METAGTPWETCGSLRHPQSKHLVRLRDAMCSQTLHFIMAPHTVQTSLPFPRTLLIYLATAGPQWLK